MLSRPATHPPGRIAGSVTFQNRPDDLKAMAFFDGRMREILDVAGARKVWTDPPPVVNAWNRAHDA